MPRVGIIALIQESNTFLQGKTTLDHFRRDLLLTGDNVRKKFATAHHEIRGFFDGLARAGFEAVPLFAARALPFGAIDAHTFETLMQMMLEELSYSGRLDGLLVAPHGATVAESFLDADGEWLSRVRKFVGPGLPIIGTLDPHGNLSKKMVDATDALISYRTNPHVDQEHRGVEAAELMVRTLNGCGRPVQAACFPPMAINIERQCTSESPCRELAEKFDHVRGRTGVLAASLMLGFPYADVPEMGSASLVVTDGNHQLAQSLANELGVEMWNVRHGLAGTFLSVCDAVSEAARLPGPVCLLDMGDNVGGGSPGDGTWIAQELLQTGVGPAFVCIDDAATVRAAEETGVGNSAKFKIGGRTDDLHGAPLEAEFTVAQLADGRYSESEVRHGGFTEFDQGRTAILELGVGKPKNQSAGSGDPRTAATAGSGHLCTTGVDFSRPSLTVMVTSKRTPPFSLKQLTAFGLDPQQFQILVAKGVNAPLAAYRTVCPSILRVNTRGVTVADMTQLSYRHRRQPMFPFEEAMNWPQ